MRRYEGRDGVGWWTQGYLSKQSASPGIVVISTIVAKYDDWRHLWYRYCCYDTAFIEFSGAILHQPLQMNKKIKIRLLSEGSGVGSRLPTTSSNS